MHIFRRCACGVVTRSQRHVSRRGARPVGSHPSRLSSSPGCQARPVIALGEPVDRCQAVPRSGCTTPLVVGARRRSLTSQLSDNRRTPSRSERTWLSTSPGGHVWVVSFELPCSSSPSSPCLWSRWRRRNRNSDGRSRVAIETTSRPRGARADGCYCRPRSRPPTTNELLAGVTVQIDGTQLGAVTSPAGTYRITNVPVGSHTRCPARRLGFARATHQVTVRDSVTVTVNFSLEKTVTTLDQSRRHGHARRRSRSASSAMPSAR
jgi:hypothetical protein